VVRNLSAGVIVAAAVAGVLALPAAASAVGAMPPRTPPLAKGKYIDISIPRATSTMVEDISDSGQIVGCFSRQSGPQHGFSEQQGTFTVLTHRSGGHPSAQTCAAGVSASGAIVGYYSNKRGDLHGFLYQHGSFTTIDAPRAGRRPGEGTTAVGINKAGVIVGFYVTAGHAERGFILRDGKFRTVNAPGAGRAVGEGTALNGIADDGTMSGLYTSGGGRQHGFWLRRGVFHRVNVPGAQDTVVACISQRTRLLVGAYRIAGHKKFLGFTFNHGVYRTLREPLATGDTIPQCGNDSGHVVGYYIGSAGVFQGFQFTPAAAASLTVPGTRGRTPASAPRSGFLAARTGLLRAK
jgi:probable HAF family extracellular repeat protein